MMKTMKKHRAFPEHGRARPSACAVKNQESFLRVCSARGATRPAIAGGILALVVVLASAAFAFAQSNGVPGDTDYSRFSWFITDRNIFNPTREPHSYVPGYRPRTRTRTHVAAPGIQLVGTMSYDKGLFAFFNGNSDEWKQALSVGGKIADYTVTDISANRVELESADQKQQLELNVGDGLRQEDGKWVLSNGGELPAIASSADASAGGNSTPAAAPSAGEPNEILKRLMQLREKENQ